MQIELAGAVVTAKPNDDELSRISIELAAFDGEVGNGVLPIPSTGEAVFTGASAIVTEGAVLVADLRVLDNDRTRGAQPTGPGLEYGYAVNDANAFFDGFRIHRSRPAETDVARVLAFAALDLPDADTTWVVNSSTLSMPAKAYDSDGGWTSELIPDVVEQTGKTIFLHDKADGSGRCLHYHVLTLGHTSGLTITDVIADVDKRVTGATHFEPKNIPTRSTTSVDLRNDVMGRDPAGHVVIHTDPTSIGIHDADGVRHQALIDFDGGNLGAQTDAFLLSQKNDRVTYTCTIGPLDEDALALIRVGDLIPVTSYAMGLTNSTQRISHMTLSVVMGDNSRARPAWWMATLELGAPIRRKAHVRAGPRVAALVRPYLDQPYVPQTDTEVASAVIYSPEGNTHFGYPPLVAFGSTGDAPAGGLPYDPLTGALEYVELTNGFGTRVMGIRTTGPATLTIHAKESFIGVYGDCTVTIRMAIVRNGITVAFDESSHTFTFPGLMTGTLEATSAPITMVTGDLIQLHTVATFIGSDGGPPTIPWGVGTGAEELRVTGTSSSGAVLNPPSAGMLVREQIVDTGGPTTDFSTNFPFSPKTLNVTVGGVTVVPAEIDGAAGTFTLPFTVDPAVVPVIVTYRAAGGDATGAVNDPNPPSVYTLVPPDLLGTGSTGAGSLVLLDDGTWGPVPPPAVTEGLVPYYIPVDTTYTVPVYKQALFSDPIEVDGALIVNGVLIGVD